MRRFYLYTLLFTLNILSVAYTQGITEKPFILEHLYHAHRVNLTNTTVYQQISNYGAFYNVTNVFFDYRFTPIDHIFISGAVAFGNGILEHTYRLGYSIEPTGANLEDYIENINDTGRKHLLELWYHRVSKKFDFVVGLMDSASFVDENEYANDENIQFLNNAFTNNPVAPLPSFNPGIFFKYKTKNKELKFLFIENEPDDGNVGVVQLNLNGEMFNIRPYIYRTFGLDEEESGFGLSSDYTNADTGYFLRIGIPFKKQSSFYSFGTVKKLNQRQTGIAFGFINRDINVYICEAYYSVDLTSHLNFTLDLQIIREKKTDLIYGLRMYMYY